MYFKLKYGQIYSNKNIERCYNFSPEKMKNTILVQKSQVGTYSERLKSFGVRKIITCRSKKTLNLSWRKISSIYNIF